jgi:hypothetical protein
MSDFEKRFVMKFCLDEGKTGVEPFRILTEGYVVGVTSLSTVKYWRKELKCGRKDSHDLTFPGRGRNEELANYIIRTHEEEPNYTARDIARALAIPLSTTCFPCGLFSA